MKALSIYIITARLARITGTKGPKYMITIVQRGTSRRCRKLHRLNSNKTIVSSIFYVFRMHLNCFLQSQTPLWGGRHTRLTVTNAHLQQKKYEVNNPKVSSPEMWLASKLDSWTMTEAAAWILRILWVLVYAGMCSADQKCIPDGLMRRMNMYRDEVEKVSGWETSSMRMATETTTKGMRGRVVQLQHRRRQKMQQGRTRRCRQQPR